MIPTLIALAVLCTPPSAPAGPAGPAGATSAVTKSVTKSVRTQSAKLEIYILKVNQGAKPYSRKLAERIAAEAKAHKLDLALFAAIAHNESWYKLSAKGRSYEFGIWQLWPYGSFMNPIWDRLRQVKHLLTGWPDVDWRKMSRAMQRKASKDVVLSTWMAAAIAAYHVRRCKRHTPRCYARYNSGNAKVRGYYVRLLRRRSKAIRKALRAR